MSIASNGSDNRWDDEVRTPQVILDALDYLDKKGYKEITEEDFLEKVTFLSEHPECHEDPPEEKICLYTFEQLQDPDFVIPEDFFKSSHTQCLPDNSK